MPRIILQGDAHYFYTTEIYLHVDCQDSGGNRELVVYVKEINTLGLVLWGSGSDSVKYSISGDESVSRRWSYDSDGDTKYWFAPTAIASDLVESLKNDPQKLVVVIRPGEEYELTHNFFPRGFSEASKPVLEACR